VLDEYALHRSGRETDVAPDGTLTRALCGEFEHAPNVRGRQTAHGWRVAIATLDHVGERSVVRDRGSLAVATRERAWFVDTARHFTTSMVKG
jgi:hypothetical protein